jgi:phage repressor protein C with HTH and peptisase S24 domain
MREISTIKEKIIQYLDFKGISKYDFYQKTGVSNGVLSQKSGMSEDNIMRFLSYYDDVNADWLFFGRGEMIKTKSKENVVEKNDHKNDHVNDHKPNVKKKYANDLTEMPMVEEERKIYNATPAIVTVDSFNKDNIVLVPQTLKAGYLQGYNDPKFIKSLPSYRMPGLTNGIFRMFEVEGNSMFPTFPNKSYVVCQFVENWVTGIKDNRVYAIISNEVEDGLLKRCINKIKKYNNLICKSDNRRNYPSQNINPESIKEVWEFKLHLNFNVPDPADIYDKIYDLEGEVSSLKEILKRAKLIE